MSEENKKPRGRPTSKKAIAAQAIKGIVEKPNSQSNIVELISNQPQIFKKLPEILKAFKQVKIWIKLNEAGLEVNFRDHLRHSYNRIVFPATAMLHYYFDPKAAEQWEPATLSDGNKSKSVYLSIICEHLSEVCRDIGDAFKEFQVLVNKEHAWYVCIVDDNSCAEINKIPRPPTMSYCPTAGTVEYESEKFDYNIDNEYLIQFTISVDKLKSIVNRANNTTVVFSKKENLRVVQIECTPKDGVPFTNIFTDPEKIALKLNCPEKDYIVVSVNSEHIKMASNTNIQFMKNVRISFSPGRQLSLRWSTTDAEDRETCFLHSYIDILGLSK